MMMMADLGAAEAAEKLFGPIGARLAVRIDFGVIDPLHFKAGVQIIPSARLVGVDDGSGRHAAADEIERAGFALEDGRKRVSATLANDDNNLALAALVLGGPP